MKTCDWCGRPEEEQPIKTGKGMKPGETLELCEDCWVPL